MKVKRIAIYIITNIALFIIACITIPKLMKKLTGKLYKKNIKKKNIIFSRYASYYVDALKKHL